MARQQVVVRLTPAQRLRCEMLGLWPGKKLSVEEISRRLLLEHLLRAESERNMVEAVRERLYPPRSNVAETDCN